MKAHTKIYFDFFGFTTADFISCEICGAMAVDIHHINAKGMGGNPNGDKDDITNLMAICRADHEKFGDITELKPKLQEVHLRYMDIYGIKK